MGSTTAENLIDEDLSLYHFLYGLMSVFAMFLLPLFIALLININQHSHSEVSSVGMSHFKWQRYSMLCFLLLCAIAYCIPVVSLSITLFIFSIIWFVYRIAKGWLSLIENQMVI